LEAELRRKPPTEKDINDETIAVLRALHWMAYYFGVAADQMRFTEEQRAEYGAYMTTDNPAATLRPWVHRHIEAIKVHTRLGGGGVRTRHKLLGGVIAFKTVGANTGELNPHLTA
jgi:hypothetical protein